MSVSYVALNGTGSGTIASTTLTFNTTRQIDSGEHVVIVANAGGGATDPVTITVGALSLTKDRASGAQTSLSIWSARAGSNIASGTTVTLTWSLGPTNREGICFSLGGIASDFYVDTSSTNTFTSNSTPDSGTSATTSIADAIAIGAVGWRTAAITCTPNAPYAEIAELNDDGGATTSVEAAYRVLTVTAPQQASWTLSGGSFGDALVVVYKGATAQETIVMPRHARLGRSGAW